MNSQTNQTIDLKATSLNDLKALVYDRLALIEQTQKEIQAINQEIGIKAQSQKSQLVENGSNG